MKRIILIIGALLIGFVMQAQSVTYTCRYWFDKNQEQAVTATFSDSIWQAELDVGLLPEGLHTLYLHVMDTSMRWGAPQSFLFLKTSSTQPSDLSYHYWFDQDHEQMQSGTVGNGILLLGLDSLNVGLHTLHVMLKDNEYSTSQSYLFLKTHPTGQGTTDFVYHCWFNQDIEHKQSNSLGSGNVLLDVADLEDGMHTINVMLEGDALTSTQSFLFMKVATFDLDTADMSHLVYHCWFDQDFENQQTDSLRDGHFLLDVDGLVDGLHTVNVMLEGGSGTLTTTQSYMFMKIAAQDPSVAMQYRCWFDQDYSTMQTGPVGAGVFEIEMGELSEGFHTLNVQLDNGSLSAPQTYLFYRLEGIDRWEYWLNGNTDIKHVTQLPQVTDTLDIVALLPVETWPIRSTCFHFQPNDNAPYLNAKNEITFRFWSSGNRFIDKSNFYVDEQVRQDIVAQVFERNTTETFAA
ncbi:MAG: hypothetical protein K6A94_08105, partial [Bacteroidales bacterium]|nr:hypothetical protein [Bacteroidales bacterium]